MSKSSLLLPLIVCLVWVLPVVGQELTGNQSAGQETIQGPNLSDAEVIEKLKKINASITDGGMLFKKKSFVRSAKRIRTAKSLMIELVADGKPETLKKLEHDYGRLGKAQELLMDKGQEFEELVPLADMGKLWGQESASKSNSKKEKPVSFTKEVAPILIEKCGRCHVQQSRGRFSTATFEAIKKGGAKGEVFKPGDPMKSSLYTLVKSGKMPPKSRNFPKKELNLIKDWIAQGAKYDGQNEKENLAALVGGNNGPGLSR